jgi:hypothetical protein
MPASKKALLAINIVGGVVLFLTLFLTLQSHQGQEDLLWGGSPRQHLRGILTTSSAVAGVSYLVCLFYILVCMTPAETRLPRGLSYGHFAIPFVLIILSATVRVPLTYAYATAPSTPLWAAIRVELLAGGLGALMLLAMLAALKYSSPRQFSWPSTSAAAYLTFHMLALNGFLWPALVR